MLDPTPHLERFESYEQACRQFRWQIPDRLNIALAISRKQRDAVTRIALKDSRPGGINTYTFGGIDFLSDKFASLLAQSGVGQGDAVAVVLHQSAALLVAHFGTLKLGAVVVPLSPDLPPSIMRRALSVCRARAIVAGAASLSQIEEVATPGALFIVGLSGPGLSGPGLGGPGRTGTGGRKDFWRALSYASSDFSATETPSTAPAFIFFLTQRDLKLTGVTHSHSSLIGQLTSFEMYNGLCFDGSKVFWTASDWVSPQVLLGIIYPALWYGCAIVSKQSISPSADETFGLMRLCQITDAFIPTTEIDRLKQIETLPRVMSEPGHKSELMLKTVLTTPGSFSLEHSEWTLGALGAELKVAYGTPETGLIATNCDKWFEPKPGALGRRAPGHSIEIVSQEGRVCSPGEQGRAALLKPDPALFSGYFGDSERTASRFIGDWFVTDDAAYKNEDGDLYISPSSSRLEEDACEAENDVRD
jgi:acetyl-CoA synthetase